MTRLTRIKGTVVSVHIYDNINDAWYYMSLFRSNGYTVTLELI